MDAIEAIRTRRSLRQLAERPVPHEIIDDVHVLRANTSMCLVTHLDHRTGPLVHAAAERGPA